MRIKSRHFWFEMGVALSMLCLFPFMVVGGGGPEQVIVPDIIINTLDIPGNHWQTSVSMIVCIAASIITTLIIAWKWMKNQKETK